MDSINVKARRLAPLDTPTDLRSDATKDIAGALTLLLTDFFALYLKTKNFHWHMSDRILVMTDRPGRIKSEYRVEMPRPRDLRGVRKMPAFHQLSERIWRDIVAGA